MIQSLNIWIFICQLTHLPTNLNNFIIQPGASPVRWYWYKIKYAISAVYQTVVEWNTTNQYFPKIESLQQDTFYIKDLQVGGHGPLPPTCDMKKDEMHFCGGPFDSLSSAKRIGRIDLTFFSVEPHFQRRGYGPQTDHHKFCTAIKRFL